MRLAVEGTDERAAVDALRVKPGPAAAEARAFESRQPFQQQLRQVLLGVIGDLLVIGVEIG